MTPYRKTKEAFRRFARRVRVPDEWTMMSFNIADIKSGSSFSLVHVWNRAHAAEKLGYDVVIKADDGNFSFHYRKRPDFSEVP